jgi:excisionase family DNA binding protein
MSALTVQERDLARAALERSGHQARLSAQDGTPVELPAAVAQALNEVLGVSRPTVVRLIDAGKLSARQVGTHRRLSLGDVIAYGEASASRRGAALERMARQAEDLGLHD